MKFYRYDMITTTSMSNGYDDGYYGNNLSLQLRSIGHTDLYFDTYVLHKETPKGYWIKLGGDPNHPSLSGKPLWISKTSVKRYAYPTKKEALFAFIKRKKRSEERRVGKESRARWAP